MRKTTVGVTLRDWPMPCKNMNAGKTKLTSAKHARALLATPVLTRGRERAPSPRTHWGCSSRVLALDRLLGSLLLRARHVLRFHVAHEHDDKHREGFG